jgi:hypothetical protein
MKLNEYCLLQLRMGRVELQAYFNFTCFACCRQLRNFKFVNKAICKEFVRDSLKSRNFVFEEYRLLEYYAAWLL